MKFDFAYFDHYPKFIMKDSVDYKAPIEHVNIRFGENEVEVLNTDLDFIYIRHLSTNICMWVHNSFVYKNESNNKFYCYDGSNQFISVKKGETISIIIKANPYSLIKKDGFIGLIETKYIDYEN